MTNAERIAVGNVSKHVVVKEIGCSLFCLLTWCGTDNSILIK